MMLIVTLNTTVQRATISPQRQFEGGKYGRILEPTRLVYDAQFALLGYASFHRHSIAQFCKKIKQRCQTPRQCVYSIAGLECKKKKKKQALASHAPCKIPLWLNDWYRCAAKARDKRTFLNGQVKTSLVNFPLRSFYLGCSTPILSCQTAIRPLTILNSLQVSTQLMQSNGYSAARLWPSSCRIRLCTAISLVTDEQPVDNGPMNTMNTTFYTEC